MEQDGVRLADAGPVEREGARDALQGKYNLSLKNISSNGICAPYEVDFGTLLSQRLFI